MMNYKNKTAKRHVTALILAAISFSTHASEQSLDDVSLENLLSMQVSSASKFLQNVSEAPSAVQIITADDIRRYGWRTVEEALNSLPGMYITQDKAYSFLGSHGFNMPGEYGTRFLLLLDGQHLNDNVYGQALISNDFPVDMGMISRIEYIPGPGSSLYGGNAMFGVINVITKSSDELPKHQASVTITQEGWREGRAMFNHQAENGLDFTAAVSRGVKQGKDLFYDYTLDRQGNVIGGQTNGLDGSDYNRYFARINKGAFSFTAWANQRTIRPSAAIYFTNFNDPALLVQDTSSHVVLKYEKAINEDLSVEGRIAHASMTYGANLPYNDGTTNYINRDESNGHWWFSEARMMYTGQPHHKIIAGIDGQSDINNTQSNYNININVPGFNPVNAIDSKKIYSLYAQDDWSFRENWRLNIGLREDHVTELGNQTSPRLGLIWNAMDGTTIKLLSGKAFRSPSSYEKLYADGVSYLQNTNLKSESIKSVEAVIDHKISGKQNLVATLFNYQINLIQQVPTTNGGLQFQNGSTLTARGLETAYRFKTENGSRFTASLAVNHTLDATGQSVLNSPRWIVKADGSQPVKGWLLGAELNIIGKRELDWYRTGTRNTQGTQWTGNVNVVAPKLFSDLEVQLRILNIFDRKLMDPGTSDSTFPAIPRDGRLWQLGANYAF